MSEKDNLVFPKLPGMERKLSPSENAVSKTLSEQ
jgi:hypothetical protein